MLLPLIFAIVSSRKARSSARIGVAFARRAATRSVGGLRFDVRLDPQTVVRSFRALAPPLEISSRHGRHRFCGARAPSRRPP